ncbi:MAG: helix-turn-helix transcriptional regulator, partial [Desulfosarcinaceae bacterium]
QALAASQDRGENVSSIGLNYLKVCDAASGEGADDARAVAAGIRAVLKGEIKEFLYDYPCHSPNRQRWFYMRAIRMDSESRAAHPSVGVIVSHEEITGLKLTEEALRQSKKEVEAHKQELEEANIALKVLLKQREADKGDLEKKVLTNIKELVFPFLERLKIAPLRSKDKQIVQILETHLNDIISPLLQQVAGMNILLTPQEMQVAALVKDGKSSKEIAEILTISETTVHFHRKNLRKKLGLKHKAANLRADLMSMS